MKVEHYRNIKAEEVKGEGISGVHIRWVITKEDGAPNFAMRVFEVAPGGNTPSHQHPWEHEVFVLKGKGKAVGKDGEKEIGPGTIIFVPPNEPHQFVNVGEEPLEFICLIPHHK
ncbi:MAG: cupin domain-containing protein [Acidobacteria bacterium]|nr:cupin domain-containing protein [Acidobacteriota bacterium]